MKDPMLDEEFLKQLDRYPHHHTWAKIISLNFDEYPQAEITGRITSGSINVDGSSALRRTCSLSLVANDVNVQDFYWSLHTKCYVYIGLENFINPDYPDIIWFKQGLFLITSFNCSVGTNNYTINIQGKDKMVLLNGEIGGVVPASWDFGKIDVTNEDGTVTQDYYPIKDIILQSVHEYAQEPWENIIVNDLDDYGIELLEYQGDIPLYYIIQYDGGDNNSREVVNMTLDGDMQCWVRQDTWDDGRQVGNKWTQTKISEIENDAESEGTSSAGRLCYEKLMEQLDPSGNVTETENYLRAIISLDDAHTNLYTVAKITRNNGMQVCGYRMCDIIYPYDLIASPGDFLTSVLDKLVQMLGNFEYFYDVDGRFIFQKKRTFIDVSFNNIINEHSINEEVWADSSMYNTKYTYTFDKDILVSSFQNSPNLSNLKNDYSLWGMRKTGDLEVPVHMRYAVDKKPIWYKSMGNKESDPNIVYCTEEGNTKYGGSEKNSDNVHVVDWREIIFQMANDYRRHYRDEDFLITVRDNNKIGNEYLYPKGYTGYEKYYIDFEMNLSQGVVAYWRELYNPIGKGESISGIYLPNGTFQSDEDVNDFNEGTEYSKNDRVKKDGIIYVSTGDKNTTVPGTNGAKWNQWRASFTYNSDGWNPDILNNPEMLNFWFDFLDTDNELGKYSVKYIGQRSKATNDDKIKAIYFRETPNVIFKMADDLKTANWIKPGYSYITIPKGLNSLFTISSRGKNAMDVVQEYLYNYTYPASAITLNTVPIYYLTPNTLIYVDDEATGAVGEYIMNKFSIQLGLSANMSINAIETAKRIY